MWASLNRTCVGCDVRLDAYHVHWRLVPNRNGTASTRAGSVQLGQRAAGRISVHLPLASGVRLWGGCVPGRQFWRVNVWDDLISPDHIAIPPRCGGAHGTLRPRSCQLHMPV
eukprot:3352018-Pyramimonas_sp.AAC.1